ncbi:MAG: response regulator, partial [Desulfobacteraceae bacterium]|nr:response regulator [Desulfobacteraceae bacterium]
ALRARDLVRQILAFSRMKSTGARVPVDVGAIFKEITAFLRATLPASIEIRPNIWAETGSALADPAQVHQVLLNLCTNAAHAMEEHGGVLYLALERIEIFTETTIAHNTLKPGSYLVLTVRDTGHGMSPETLERIFDPYFTTKEVGKGSGLGLAVVRGIVDHYEGAVEVRSEPGKGTTFKVYLPRTSDIPGTMDTKTGSLPHGTEQILCVDDEEEVSAVTGGMLSRLGYRVERKTDCLKALDAFRAAPDRFDLIITDYALPHMNGIDFAGEVIKCRPCMPMILCTGYGDRIDEGRMRRAGIRAFAVKPLNLRELAELVRNTLDESRVSSLRPVLREKNHLSKESECVIVG